FADTRAANEIDLHNTEQLATLSPTELEAARAANRRVIIRIDALDPDIIERIQPASQPTNPVEPTAEPDEITPSKPSNTASRSASAPSLHNLSHPPQLPPKTQASNRPAGNASPCKPGAQPSKPKLARPSTHSPHGRAPAAAN